MGKASQRKSQRRRGSGQSRADFERQRAFATIHVAAGQIVRMIEAEHDRQAEAAKWWCGGVMPERAALPSWAPDSVGDRFFSGNDIAAAATAPPLADAILPAEKELSRDSVHWAVAISALVRAVVLDGLDMSDPAVTALTDLLTPVVTREVAYAEDENADPEFPEVDGPLLALGGCALVDATWAVSGAAGHVDPLAVGERRPVSRHRPGCTCRIPRSGRSS